MMHNLCINSGTFMFFVNKLFLLKHLFEITILETKFNLCVRDINFKIYINLKYILLNLYFFELINKISTMTHLRVEIYLINKFKTNMLINMNVIKSKKIMIISICKNFKTLIIIQKKTYQ